MATPGYFDNTKRKSFDINRATVNDRGSMDSRLNLFVVTASTAISGASYRWLYTIKPAQISEATPYSPSQLSGADPAGYPALSISELGNDVTGSPNRKYAYGVLESDLSGTLVPVKIPTGTPVMAYGWNRAGGTTTYLIINTQALSGVCQPP